MDDTGRSRNRRKLKNYESWERRQLKFQFEQTEVSLITKTEVGKIIYYCQSTLAYAFINFSSPASKRFSVTVEGYVQDRPSKWQIHKIYVYQVATNTYKFTLLATLLYLEWEQTYTHTKACKQWARTYHDRGGPLDAVHRAHAARVPPLRSSAAHQWGRSGPTTPVLVATTTAAPWTSAAAANAWRRRGGGSREGPRHLIRKELLVGSGDVVLLVVGGDLLLQQVLVVLVVQGAGPPHGARLFGGGAARSPGTAVVLRHGFTGDIAPRGPGAARRGARGFPDTAGAGKGQTLPPSPRARASDVAKQRRGDDVCADAASAPRPDSRTARDAAWARPEGASGSNRRMTSLYHRLFGGGKNRPFDQVRIHNYLRLP